MTNKYKNIEDLLADDSFIRWIEGTASPHEVSDWNHWLTEDPGRKKCVKQAKKIHNGFKFKRKIRSNAESELARLNRAIDKSESIKFHRKTPMMGYIERRTRYLPQVAAVFLILLMILAAAHFLLPDAGIQDETNTPVYSTVQTDYGEKKRIEFTDGSSILLNGNTRLTYPSQIFSGDFQVQLEGEAWFEIASETGQSPRTFRVRTHDGHVEVLGTEFNVNTWQGRTEVVLQEGKIRVELKNNLNRINNSYIMTPGELARFTDGGESIQVDRINTELYTSWIQNRLTFDRTPLTDVAERIGQIYGVQIAVDMTDLKMEEIRISGSLPNDNLQVFLNALERVLERPVSLENGTIHLNTESDR